MIEPDYGYKHYNAAKHRFFSKVLVSFLSDILSQHFGPILLEKMAKELIELFEKYAPDTTRLKPGQMLWTALDKRTRGDNPNRKYVPVVLTVVSSEDVEQLIKGEKMVTIRKNSYARMYREAYAQGGALSSRDIALLSLRYPTDASKIRMEYEKEHNCVLPHTGVLHDMGTTLTHKRQIVESVYIDKKDPADVARECHHSQKAVDRYLRDFSRVKTAYDYKPDIHFVQVVTGMSKNVVMQYLEIAKNV